MATSEDVGADTGRCPDCRPDLYPEEPSPAHDFSDPYLAMNDDSGYGVVRACAGCGLFETPVDPVCARDRTRDEVRQNIEAIVVAWTAPPKRRHCPGCACAREGR